MLAAVLRTNNSEDKRQDGMASAKPAGRTHRCRRPVQRHLYDKRYASNSTESAYYQQDALDAISRQHALTVAGDGRYDHFCDVQQAN
jgi:hypothetical protein